MEARLARAEILRRLETEYLRLTTTLAELTPEQMTRVGVLEGWSVKDLLAHMIYWNHHPVMKIQSALEGEQPTYEALSVDEINARSVADYAGMTPQQVRNAFDDSFLTVVDCIHALPAEVFQPDNWLEDLMGETVHGVLAEDTYDHYAEHCDEIRAWLGR